MEREVFLNRLAIGLRRGRVTNAPARDVRGVPEHYSANPYGHDCAASADLDIVERFKNALEGTGGHVILTADRQKASEALQQLLEDLAPSTTITWDQSEFRGWPIEWLWEKSGAIQVGAAGAEIVGAVRNRETALAADIGITTADCAIANTGTLMLNASPGRPRSASLLPAVHIALVSADQIVDRMGEALDRFRETGVRDIPSSISFITGQSRSADIEGDISIGVHGPAAIYVIVAR